MIGLDLISNGVVAILLACTIWYAFNLNRRLGVMRAQQEEFSRLVLSLNQATARAQEGIYELKTISQTSAESLRAEIAKARALADELAIITEAGNNLADRIEMGLTRNGSAAAATPAAKPAPANSAPVMNMAGRLNGGLNGKDLKDLLQRPAGDKRYALKAAR